ncbi:MAG: thioredoxin domain-containing protein [Candidatus Dadabacteria bacterium]|nr:thioredoxin domain-containing protein [Candidatus Dadabacteria bacterium]NIQ16705.1 thioredoxin domain-containing protein [Candidatus Dadabacteria bacterium]
MNIIFYYDYICPFCFIGTKRISRLIKEYDLNVEWRGIEIHPEYSVEGKKRKKTARLDHIIQTLNDIAKEDNTEIELPGFVTNTRLPLESAEYAKTEGKFIDFHNALYEAYFKNRINIGLLDNLTEIAQAVGLNMDSYLDSINERKFKKAIDSNKAIANENLVLGVPTIYFNELRIHGVQSADAYKSIIEKELLNNKIIH